MEAINQLEYSYFLARSGTGDYRDCIDWAMERLRRNEEGDDADVIEGSYNRAISAHHDGI
jgi:hypothetical protein